MSGYKENKEKEIKRAIDEPRKNFERGIKRPTPEKGKRNPNKSKKKKINEF